MCLYLITATYVLWCLSFGYLLSQKLINIGVYIFVTYFDRYNLFSDPYLFFYNLAKISIYIYRLIKGLKIVLMTIILGEKTMKMFVRNCGIALIGAAFAMNVYAGLGTLPTKLGARAVKSLFRINGQAAMKKLGKFHKLSYEMMEDLGGSLRMKLPLIIKELESDPVARDLMAKKVSELSTEDMVALTDAVSAAMIKVQKRDKTVVYSCGSACVVPEPNALGGKGIRANFTVPAISTQKLIEKAGSSERKAFLKSFEQNPLSMGPGKKMMIEMDKSVIDVDNKKLYMILQLASKDSAGNEEVALAKAVLDYFAVSAGRKGKKLVVTDEVSRFINMALQTEKKNAGEVKAWIDEANKRIGKKKLSKKEKTNVFYQVVREKDPKLADELNAKGCYWVKV